MNSKRAFLVDLLGGLGAGSSSSFLSGISEKVLFEGKPKADRTGHRILCGLYIVDLSEATLSGKPGLRASQRPGVPLTY